MAEIISMVGIISVAVQGTVNREDLGTRLSCFGCELEKMADISLVSRVRTRLKTWQEQQEDNSKGDVGYLENICGAGQT